MNKARSFTSRNFARDLGPLLLIALLVPGGSLIAGAIYFFRRNSS